MNKIIISVVLLLLSGCVGLIQVTIPPECTAVITYPGGYSYNLTTTKAIIISLPYEATVTIYPINGFAYNLTEQDGEIRAF